MVELRSGPPGEYACGRLGILSTRSVRISGTSNELLAVSLSLELFKKYLGVSLQIVQRLFLARQFILRRLNETLLNKPVSSLCREDEHPVQPLTAGFLLQHMQ